VYAVPLPLHSAYTSLRGHDDILSSILLDSVFGGPRFRPQACPRDARKMAPCVGSSGLRVEFVLHLGVSAHQIPRMEATSSRTASGPSDSVSPPPADRQRTAGVLTIRLSPALISFPFLPPLFNFNFQTSVIIP